MGHLSLKTTPDHAFNFNTSFMSFVIKKGHVEYFKYRMGTSFLLMLSVELCSQTLEQQKKH